MSNQPNQSEPNRDSDGGRGRLWTLAMIKRDAGDDWEPPLPRYEAQSRNEGHECTTWNPQLGRRGDGTVTAWITSNWSLGPEELRVDAIDGLLPTSHRRHHRGGGE